jgi:hypothetical protein
MGAWEHGSMGAWEHGSMGAWEHGSMGAWEHGNTILHGPRTLHTTPHGNCGLAIGPEGECRGLGLEQWRE